VIKKSKIKNNGTSKPLIKTSKKSEPQTMEELLAQTGYVLRGLKRGNEVKGTVTNVGKKEILVDIGGKSEGVVLGREFEAIEDLLPTIKVGDKISAIVTAPENESGQTVLSLRQTGLERRWQVLKEAFTHGEEIEVTGLEPTRGGLLVNFAGLRGFIPTSCLDPSLSGNPQELIGRRIKGKILEFSEAQNRLVISQKAVTMGKEIEEALSKIKIGEEYEGEIKGLAPFGAFIDVLGLEGLVHISEIAWEKVEKPEDYFKIGEKAKIKVLSVDRTAGRLNLSVKQLTPDPWDKVTQNYKIDTIVKGKITRKAPYGFFVNLEPGIEGLIHISKISPGQEFAAGEKIECLVERIDKLRRQISLSPILKEKPVGYR